MDNNIWHHVPKFNLEYNRLLETFFVKFRSWFPKECTPPMLCPNYILFSSELLENAGSTEYVQVNDNNEFLFVAYPHKCAVEITEELTSLLPAHVKEITVQYDYYEIAKWILGAFLSYSVDIASMRLTGKRKALDEKQAIRLLKFTNVLEYNTIRTLVLIVSNLFRNNMTFPIGIMDFDPDYIPKV